MHWNAAENLLLTVPKIVILGIIMSKAKKAEEEKKKALTCSKTLEGTFHHGQGQTLQVRLSPMEQQSSTLSRAGCKEAESNASRQRSPTRQSENLFLSLFGH